MRFNRYVVVPFLAKALPYLLFVLAIIISLLTEFHFGEVWSCFVVGLALLVVFIGGL